ncbi:hypothetical protein MMPV_000674 [Pyropia vietnamensis]
MEGGDGAGRIARADGGEYRSPASAGDARGATASAADNHIVPKDGGRPGCQAGRRSRSDGPADGREEPPPVLRRLGADGQERYDPRAGGQWDLRDGVRREPPRGELSAAARGPPSAGDGGRGRPQPALMAPVVVGSVAAESAATAWGALPKWLSTGSTSRGGPLPKAAIFPGRSALPGGATAPTTPTAPSLAVADARLRETEAALAAEEAAIRDGRRTYVKTAAELMRRHKVNDAAAAALVPDEAALRARRIAHMRGGHPRSAERAAIDAEAKRLADARRKVTAEAAALAKGDADVREGRRQLTARKSLVTKKRHIADLERKELEQQHVELRAAEERGWVERWGGRLDGHPNVVDRKGW